MNLLMINKEPTHCINYANFIVRYHIFSLISSIALSCIKGVVINQGTTSQEQEETLLKLPLIFIGRAPKMYLAH